VPGSFSVKRFQEFLLFRQWKRLQPADSISASVLTVKKHHRLAFDCNEWLPFAFRIHEITCGASDPRRLGPPANVWSHR
jgi:hypothetical protein